MHQLIRHTTYHTLQSLLDDMGCKTPADLGRAFYKNTRCGVAVSFRMQTAEACDRKLVFVVTKSSAGPLQCSAEPDNTWGALRFLGFDQCGNVLGSWRSLDGYMERVRRLMKSQASMPSKLLSFDLQACTRDGDVVLVFATQHLRAHFRDFYYADAPPRIPRCTGISVSSIVEGSDVEIPAEYLTFPFTSADLDLSIKRIEDQVDEVVAEMEAEEQAARKPKRKK